MYPHLNGSLVQSLVYTVMHYIAYPALVSEGFDERCALRATAVHACQKASAGPGLKHFDAMPDPTPDAHNWVSLLKTMKNPQTMRPLYCNPFGIPFGSV